MNHRKREGNSIQKKEKKGTTFLSRNEANVKIMCEKHAACKSICMVSGSCKLFLPFKYMFNEMFYIKKYYYFTIWHCLPHSQRLVYFAIDNFKVSTLFVRQQSTTRKPLNRACLGFESDQLLSVLHFIPQVFILWHCIQSRRPHSFKWLRTHVTILNPLRDANELT